MAEDSALLAMSNVEEPTELVSLPMTKVESSGRGVYVVPLARGGLGGGGGQGNEKIWCRRLVLGAETLKTLMVSTLNHITPNPRETTRTTKQTDKHKGKNLSTCCRIS